MCILKCQHLESANKTLIKGSNEMKLAQAKIVDLETKVKLIN